MRAQRARPRPPVGCWRRSTRSPRGRPHSSMHAPPPPAKVRLAPSATGLRQAPSASGSERPPRGTTVDGMAGGRRLGGARARREPERVARGAGSRRGTSAGRTATFVLLSPGVLWQTFPFPDGWGWCSLCQRIRVQINASPEQEGGYTASRATIFLGNVVRAPHARARTSHWSMGGYK